MMSKCASPHEWPLESMNSELPGWIFCKFNNDLLGRSDDDAWKGKELQITLM